MSQIAIDKSSSKIPFIYFGTYCFAGFSVLTYMSYKGFSKASLRFKPDRDKTAKMKMSKSMLLSGIAKGALGLGLYSLGFVYLAMNLDVQDYAFRSLTKKDDAYTKKIKGDPFYHNFFIINVMHYFGISERLIKKTEEQLKTKVIQNEDKNVKQGGLINFEKQVIGFVQYLGGEKSDSGENKENK